ncbi:hypothetical protein ACFL0M_05255 [Thermodesulfobacteriota bacterium]
MDVEIRVKFWQNPGFYLSLIFLAFVVVVIVLSLDFTRRARVFPMIVSLASLPLILADVLAKIFAGINRKMEALQGDGLLDTSKIDTGDSSSKAPAGAGNSKKVDTRIFLRLFLWFGGCFALFCIFGYLIAVVVFLFFFLKFFCSCRLSTAIEITAGVAVPAWMIFSFFLKVPTFW